MDPRSEVLLRQRHLFATPLLLAGLPADDLLAELPQAQGWSWHAGEQAQLDARFPDRSRFDTRAPTGAWTSAVLFLPKSRELTDYLLASLAARLPGGELFLVGEKRGGIERASKQLAAYGKPRKLDSARHCQLWQVRIEQAPAEPDLHALAQRYSLPLADGELQVVSLPGCSAMAAWIAAARAAGATASSARRPSAGLRLRCRRTRGGSQRRYPASRLTLLDVDAFAVESSRLTLAANGLDGEVIAADGIDGAPRELAAIVSNPPFHQGVHTDYQASERLLQRAAEHLAPGGELRLVANSFLKYPPLIERHLGPCRTLAEGDGFRIYSARRS